MKNKKQINKDAWYAIGGSIGIAVMALIVLILNVVDGFDISELEGSIASFILAIIAMGISIIGLYKNKKPARDGIFSAVFILHIILAFSLVAETYWAFIGIIVVIIIACVFDSLYEGFGNSKDKHGKNPIKADQRKVK